MVRIRHNTARTQNRKLLEVLPNTWSVKDSREDRKPGFLKVTGFLIFPKPTQYLKPSAKSSGLPSSLSIDHFQYHVSSFDFFRLILQVHAVKD
jgi:hypothetical protein